MCCAVGDPGMHSDPGVELRVGRGHHRRHGAAGGESGDIDPGGVDLVVGHDLTGDAGDDRRLARACPLVGGGEPVPVAAAVGRGGLLRVRDEERVLLGEVIHPGACGEVGGVLLAAVQHDDQRYRRTGVAGGDVEVIASGPGWVGVVQVADLTAGCGGRRGRARVRGRRGGRSLSSRPAGAAHGAQPEAACAPRAESRWDFRAGDDGQPEVRLRACAAEPRRPR